MGSLGLQDSIILHSWYLDDGLFIGTPDDMAHLFQKIQERGPEFGLELKPSKCEVYLPSGSSILPGLHPDIIRLIEGDTFLGTPVRGTDSYISSYVADIIWKVKQIQSSIRV